MGCNSQSLGIATIEVSSIVAISLASKIGYVEPTTPAPTTTPPPTPARYKKTVILLRHYMDMTRYPFIRGGTSHKHGNDCTPGPNQLSQCAITIIHNTLVKGEYNISWYRAWSEGDEYLDFGEDEPGQGSKFATYHLVQNCLNPSFLGKFNGTKAYGTPLIYSSNNPKDEYYHPYNRYGDGYFMVGFTTKKEWEDDIHQKTCRGSIGGSAPFTSVYHIAKCGAINAFIWGRSGCVIDNF
ncbi:unnamed protein product [Strongylus vulgaris]|uniref:Uncharacterized protein n=1 Tax=Strongylus vulgaris TaxID=40348 RepID=A0A3P7L179_STRVU|nr:unnamed protein product [Strongylus vulgaris]